MFLAPFALLAFPFLAKPLTFFGPLLGFDGALPFFLVAALALHDDVVYLGYRNASGRNFLDDIFVWASFLVLASSQLDLVVFLATEVAAEPFLAVRIDTVKFVAAFLVVELGSLVINNFYTHQNLTFSRNHLLN
jgi:hypothetical protein